MRTHANVISMKGVPVGRRRRQGFPCVGGVAAWCRTQQEMAVKILVMLACALLSSGAFAECATNGRGAAACGNGQTAGGYNQNTGNAWKAERNQAGVTTTQTSKGGEAKTKNGKGVYKSPSGQTCYKSANSRGCN
jgi:hypothetical protein